MRDVEELLRETLSDPRRRIEATPAMYETVRSRVRERRRHRSTMVAASLAVVAIAAVGSVVGVRHASHHAPTAKPTSPTPAVSPAHGTLGTAVDLGQSLNVDDAVTTADGLYALTSDPDKVVLLDPAGTQVKATADAPTGVPSGLAVGADHVWAWSQNGHQLRVYDAKTLAVLGDFSTTAAMFSGVTVGDALYLTTDQGVKLAHVDTAPNGWMVTVEPVALSGSVYGLAADPSRHRLLVGVMSLDAAPSSGFTGMHVVAIDTRTRKVVAQSKPTAFGKESIAVVGDQVWVAGYGDADKQRVLHLDGKTLKVVGSSPAGKDVGPGGTVWAGSNVVWLRTGASEGLSCLDPKTGAVLEQWDTVQGPITSVGGSAFGVENGLQPLNLAGACTG